jgi:hypothetical protein
MLPLRELQAVVGAGILGDAPEKLRGVVREDGLAFDRRLQVYRNNSFISLTEVLKATFPVVCRLVDEQFFRYAADAFIRACPPQAPCLSEYGGAFADFLTAFAPAQRLAYLPDVARLEWAINEAYFADDGPPLEPARIAALPQERYGALGFRLHPSCRLVASAYPVDRIWQAHQPDGDLDTPIDLAAGGCRLLVQRRGLDVQMTALDAAGHAFLVALDEGQSLQHAYETAAAIDGAFDLVAALATHLARGSFSDIRDAAAPQERAP